MYSTMLVEKLILLGLCSFLPSVLGRSIPSRGLGSASAALAAPALFRRDATCPANLPQSCTNGVSPSGVDACCTNTPGGQMLQTQFWDTDPSTGPADSWTVHGLWPDHCDGTYDANCDASRAYTDIRSILQNAGATDLLDYMNTYWKDYQGDDNSFWAHEWGKHGTCISTLDVSCYGPTYVQMEEVVEYFERAVSLFKTLPTYKWLTAAGIVPSATATYTLAQLQAVATANFGYEAIWQCVNGALDEVWYAYTTTGTIESGSFFPSAPDGAKSSCPDTGIQWLPKYSNPTVPPPTGPSGKVFINVVVQDQNPPTKRGLTTTPMLGSTSSSLYVNKRLSKHATRTTSQDPIIAERQFDPKRTVTKRADCPGPLPSGVCQQTCGTNFTPQTDGSCVCKNPYVLSGSSCVLESQNSGGTVNGCLISSGKWYTTGTCAGYTIVPIQGTTDFTMTTSKGPCQVTSSGVLTCAAGITNPTAFSVDADQNLVTAGSSNFYSDTIAAGTNQVPVLTTQAAHSLKLRYGPSS